MKFSLRCIDSAKVIFGFYNTRKVPDLRVIERAANQKDRKIQPLPDFFLTEMLNSVGSAKKFTNVVCLQGHSKVTSSGT